MTELKEESAPGYNKLRIADVKVQLSALKKEEVQLEAELKAVARKKQEIQAKLGKLRRTIKEHTQWSRQNYMLIEPTTLTWRHFSVPSKPGPALTPDLQRQQDHEQEDEQRLWAQVTWMLGGDKATADYIALQDKALADGHVADYYTRHDSRWSTLYHMYKADVPGLGWVAVDPSGKPVIWSPIRRQFLPRPAWASSRDDDVEFDEKGDIRPPTRFGGGAGAGAGAGVGSRARDEDGDIDLEPADEYS